MNKAEIESELLGSRKWFDSNEAVAIKSFLAREFGVLMSLFVLHHHFGQSEEHYVVMIDGKYIAELEVRYSVGKETYAKYPPDVSTFQPGIWDMISWKRIRRWARAREEASSSGRRDGSRGASTTWAIRGAQICISGRMR